MRAPTRDPADVFVVYLFLSDRPDACPFADGRTRPLPRAGRRLRPGQVSNPGQEGQEDADEENPDEENPGEEGARQGAPDAPGLPQGGVGAQVLRDPGGVRVGVQRHTGRTPEQRREGPPTGTQRLPPRGHHRRLRRAGQHGTSRRRGFHQATRRKGDYIGQRQDDLPARGDGLRQVQVQQGEGAQHDAHRRGRAARHGGGVRGEAGDSGGTGAEE